MFLRLSANDKKNNLILSNTNEKSILNKTIEITKNIIERTALDADNPKHFTNKISISPEIIPALYIPET